MRIIVWAIEFGARSTFAHSAMQIDGSFTANKRWMEEMGKPESVLTLGNNTGTTWGGNHPKQS
jgi:hypothetical protein